MRDQHSALGHSISARYQQQHSAKRKCNANLDKNERDAKRHFYRNRQHKAPTIDEAMEDFASDKNIAEDGSLYVCGSEERQKNILKIFRTNNREKQDMLDAFEEVSSEIAYYGKLKLEDSLCTPMDRYLLFSQSKTHHHHPKDCPLDIEKPLALFASHPQRWSDPRASLSNDAKNTLAHLSSKRTFERFILPRFTPRRVERGSSTEEKMDVGLFLKDLVAYTSIPYYGYVMNCQALTPMQSLCVIYRLDGVDRHFLCLVFDSVSYLTELDPENSIVYATRIPPESISARFIYYFYFLCDCKRST